MSHGFEVELYIVCAVCFLFELSNRPVVGLSDCPLGLVPCVFVSLTDLDLSGISCVQGLLLVPPSGLSLLDERRLLDLAARRLRF